MVTACGPRQSGGERCCPGARPEGTQPGARRARAQAARPQPAARGPRAAHLHHRRLPALARRLPGPRQRARAAPLRRRAARLAAAAAAAALLLSGASRRRAAAPRRSRFRARPFLDLFDLPCHGEELIWPPQAPVRPAPWRLGRAAVAAAAGRRLLLLGRGAAAAASRPPCLCFLQLVQQELRAWGEVGVGVPKPGLGGGTTCTHACCSARHSCCG